MKDQNQRAVSGLERDDLMSRLDHPLFHGESHRVFDIDRSFLLHPVSLSPQPPAFPRPPSLPKKTPKQKRYHPPTQSYIPPDQIKAPHRTAPHPPRLIPQIYPSSHHVTRDDRGGEWFAEAGYLLRKVGRIKEDYRSEAMGRGAGWRGGEDTINDKDA